MIGGSAAAIDLTLFAILMQMFGLGWAVSAVFSFVFATLANYFLSVRMLFESGARFKKNHEIVMIIVVSSIGLVVNQISLAALIEWAAINTLLAKVIATSVVFFWNYGTRSYFIFRRI
jgi:putative flippase GtrA